jgi:purine-binding chemotaxis protein CheW
MTTSPASSLASPQAGTPGAIPWDENARLEVLSFDLGQEVFALEAVLVREILDLLPETAVPGAMPLVGSVVNFRGKIIPIADLRLAFGMPVREPTPDSRIVVIEMELDGETIQLGIRTDKVHEVATLHQSDSEDPPAVGMQWKRDFVRKLVRAHSGIIVLPDINQIFRASQTGTHSAPSHCATTH